VLPLQLGEVQRDVGVRRLDVDDPVPGEAAGRVAGAADDRRIGDRSGDLPPELPRRHRQLPRPPPLPRRRHARTHARLALADRLYLYFSRRILLEESSLFIMGGHGRRF
jgi:hypothetical protein